MEGFRSFCDRAVNKEARNVDLVTSLDLGTDGSPGNCCKHVKEGDGGTQSCRSKATNHDDVDSADSVVDGGASETAEPVHQEVAQEGFCCRTRIKDENEEEAKRMKKGQTRPQSRVFRCWNSVKQTHSSSEAT